MSKQMFRKQVWTNIWYILVFGIIFTQSTICRKNEKGGTKYGKQKANI